MKKLIIGIVCFLMLGSCVQASKSIEESENVADNIVIAEEVSTKSENEVQTECITAKEATTQRITTTEAKTQRQTTTTTEATTQRRITTTTETTTKQAVLQALDGGSGYQSDYSAVTVPVAAETGENLVWVPVNGGTKYHSRSSCSNMINPIQVSIDTAKGKGYTACKRCH